MNTHRFADLRLEPKPGQVVRTRHDGKVVRVEVVDEESGRVLERHEVESGAEVRVSGVRVPTVDKQTRGGDGGLGI